MGRQVFDDKLLALIADNSLGVLATVKREDPQSASRSAGFAAGQFRRWLVVCRCRGRRAADIAGGRS
jgi:hypothetical protein